MITSTELSEYMILAYLLGIFIGWHFGKKSNPDSQKLEAIRRYKDSLGPEVCTQCTETYQIASDGTCYRHNLIAYPRS